MTPTGSARSRAAATVSETTTRSTGGLRAKAASTRPWTRWSGRFDGRRAGLSRLTRCLSVCASLQAVQRPHRAMVWRRGVHDEDVGHRLRRRAQARLTQLPRSSWARFAARLIAIAWVAAGVLRAVWPTTSALPNGLWATCHWKVVPAATSVAIAVAGATALVTLWADENREIGPAALAITAGLVVAWVLAAFVGLPAAGRTCAN
jgi:hypothetical protein